MISALISTTHLPRFVHYIVSCVVNATPEYYLNPRVCLQFLYDAPLSCFLFLLLLPGLILVELKSSQFDRKTQDHYASCSCTAWRLLLTPQLPNRTHIFSTSISFLPGPPLLSSPNSTLSSHFCLHSMNTQGIASPRNASACTWIQLVEVLILNIHEDHVPRACLVSQNASWLMCDVMTWANRMPAPA